MAAATEKHNTPPSLVKITRPNLEPCFRRVRLFDKLDEALRHPVTWIEGPAGSGKTVLAASYADHHNGPCLWYQLDAGDADPATWFYYLDLALKRALPRRRTSLPTLTPDYLGDVDLFTRRFFEQLFAALGPTALVVFDDYHTVPSDAPLHGLMTHALAMVPERENVLFTSRDEPPAPLARLRASRGMTQVGWDDLQVTADEAQGIAESHGQREGAPSAESVGRLNRQADGWAAGLVIMLEQWRPGMEVPDVQNDPVSRQVIFDYFAHELFEQATPAVQHTLLTTAVLPQISVKNAQALTGDPRAGQVLEEIARGNYFTYRHRGKQVLYQYHPLFRRFLLETATARLPAEDLAAIRKQAATFLEQENRVEDAATLLLENDDTDSLASLVLGHAEALIHSGRYRVLERWLNALPNDLLNRDPWLQFWQGVARVPFDLQAGRAFFAGAYRKFEQKKLPAGMYLAWAGVAETFLFDYGDYTTFEPWITELDRLVERHPDQLSPELEPRVAAAAISGLLWSRPDHPALHDWAKKAAAGLERTDNPGNKVLIACPLMHYYVWMADTENLGRVRYQIMPLLKGARVPPHVRLMWANWEIVAEWFTGTPEQCQNTLTQALELGEKYGIRHWDGHLRAHSVYGALSMHDIDRADTELSRVEALLPGCQPLFVGHYHHLCAWRAALTGDFQQAATHARLSAEVDTRCATPFTQAMNYQVLAHVLPDIGKADEAKRYLDKAQAVGRAVDAGYLNYLCAVTEAQLALDDRRQGDAESALATAFALGRERGLANLLLRADVLSRLCNLALEKGIEPDYARQVIRTRHLSPPENMAEHWPRGTRIYMLGDFRLEPDGKSAPFSRKAKKKPFNALKLLVAAGVNGLRTEWLADQLWPDATDDAASQSLRTTLSRLRKLVGPHAFQVTEGRIALDPRHVWVDAWEMNTRLTRVDVAATDHGVRELERALRLCRGRLLEGEESFPSVLEFRGRLLDRMHRLLASVADVLCRKRRCDEIAPLLEKAVEIDPFTEAPYRKLMACHAASGNTAKALSVYRRYQRGMNLSGSQPSAEMAHLYENIRNGTGTVTHPA